MPAWIELPAWFGKKTSKNKEQQQQQLPEVHDLIGNKKDLSKSSLKNDNKKVKDKAKSCDDLLGKRNSPRNSKDLTGGGSGSLGVSGFDSDKAHPLPRPSISSLGTIDHHGVGGAGVAIVGFGSGSGSVSSCSSGSSDDHNAQTHQAQISHFFRGHGETKLMPVARSPGPGSRGTTTTTSPLHPRFSGSNLESPTGKQEDGKAECHRLPLPPGSPTSPSTLPAARTFMVTESAQSNFSKWRKGRLLGRGTFGHVYLGFNSEGGHMCAIKEVRVITDDKTTKECLKQLNQEITLLSQLSHPNIVQYYGSELGEETLSVYLEYISGGSIHKLLEEYGPFKEPVIQNYTRQILSGLAYLHGRNTVHRDIKGANILVDPNGEIKLADFGMAKHITACSSMLSFKGSPYWMAPEVVMNTNGYSLPVDIWSLGCTILEMASAKPPWSQFEGVAAIFKIGNSKDIPEIPDHLSNDAKSFLKLCLNRDPSRRPTALQLLDHPFVREQGTPRHSSSNLTKEVSPYSSDGGCTLPTTSELRSNRWNLNFLDGDHLTRPLATTSRAAMISPRDNSARMITSLPVSPSSSPLRQSESAYRSCFLSPPHPSYALVGQNYNVHPLRRNSPYILDSWRENPQFKTLTPPGGSPRVRQI